MNQNQILEMILQRNPGLAQNPQAAEIINCFRSGNQQQAQQLASRLCQQYGVDPNQTAQQAKQMFSQMRGF